jgi:hypothetical protein
MPNILRNVLPNVASLKTYSIFWMCAFSSDMSLEVTIENVTLVYTFRGDTTHKMNVKKKVTLLSIYKCYYLLKVIFYLS